jgi:hypothetical protein
LYLLRNSRKLTAVGDDSFSVILGKNQAVAPQVNRATCTLTPDDKWDHFLRHHELQFGQNRILVLE